MPNKRPTLNNIQALRAVAALLVVFFHFAGSKHIELRPAFGSYGVQLFFVISGFIISHVAGDDARVFFVRRFVRIAPIYWIVTIGWFATLLLAPSLGDGGPVTTGRLLRSLTFVPDDPIVFRGWTLNYEMYFYVIFALSLAVAKRAHTIVCGAVVLCVMIGVRVADVDGRPAFYGAGIVSLFLVGMAIHAVWIRAGRSSRTVVKLAGCKWAIASLGLLALVGAGLSEALHFPFSDVAIGVLSALTVSAALMVESFAGLMVRNEVISARNVLVLEVGEDECGFSDVTDLVGAGGDVAQDGPAGFQQGEASFAMGAQAA